MGFGKFALTAWYWNRAAEASIGSSYVTIRVLLKRGAFSVIRIILPACLIMLLVSVPSVQAQSSPSPANPQNPSSPSLLNSLDPSGGTGGSSSTRPSSPSTVQAAGIIPSSTKPGTLASAGRGLPGMPGGPPIKGALGSQDPSSAYMRPAMIGALLCDPLIDGVCD